ncbi:MAG TPA: DUF3501 domain-containing protein [Gammaproteobacteria bacterium]|nr:DUF3501 domain-containing protein [Gammaproteobacteria bacterium]|tara:strand:- start:6890 stop:7468 length:579 start_codon:yes stop_codon:yes gene_type:complete
MNLSRTDLWSLEEYSQRRPTFRQEVITHKQQRQIALGPNATLYFEDALTMKYQIQEMLRVERIFDASEIEEELSAYNPLIPDGSNWKATFMIEYGNAEERRVALAKLGGIEETLWVQVDDGEKTHPIANEDIDRSREDKAAAVHFLRFELNPAQVTALKAGARLSMGIDHPEMTEAVVLDDAQRTALVADLT